MTFGLSASYLLSVDVRLLVQEARLLMGGLLLAPTGPLYRSEVAVFSFGRRDKLAEEAYVSLQCEYTYEGSMSKGSPFRSRTEPRPDADPRAPRQVRFGHTNNGFPSTVRVRPDRIIAMDAGDGVASPPGSHERGAVPPVHRTASL